MLAAVPCYFQSLTNEEQTLFKNLQSDITKALDKTPKNTKISENFGVVVDLLMNFVSDNNKDSELRRSLVCGFLKLDDCVAINTRQLCKTVGKCKSTINNGLQALGYVTKIIDAKLATDLTNSFPFMRSDFSAMRQWTFRFMPKLETQVIKYFNNMCSDSEPFSCFNWEANMLDISKMQFNIPSSEPLFMEESNVFDYDITAISLITDM